MAEHGKDAPPYVADYVRAWKQGVPAAQVN